MSTTIKPTVGRIVWFYPANTLATSGFAPPNEGQPLAAIITRVIDDACGGVHLTVFDAEGVPHPMPYVQLLQDGEEAPPTGRYATWMPYQIGQAKKHAGDVARAQEPTIPGLLPHQQRVVDEKLELDEKLTKLGAFFDTPMFAGLDEDEKSRLERQEEAMTKYSVILGERIAAFQAAASTTV